MWLHFAGKADKKAAQAKIQQQEHKRQVCFYCSRHLLCVRVRVCVCVWIFFFPQTDTLALVPYFFSQLVFVLQEREGELRAMARKIRMK